MKPIHYSLRSKSKMPKMIKNCTAMKSRILNSKMRLDSLVCLLRSD